MSLQYCETLPEAQYKKHQLVALGIHAALYFVAFAVDLVGLSVKYF